MLPEPPRMRPWNHHSLRPFSAGTGSVSKFQLRRGDVLAMNAVPGTLVVSPSLARISQTGRCVGVLDLRKSICTNDLPQGQGETRCRQSVAWICLDLHRLKGARWWRVLTVAG